MAGFIREHGFLLVIVVSCFAAGLLVGPVFQGSARAEDESSAVAGSDIIVVPLDLGSNSAGFVMVDVRAERLWIYELMGRNVPRNRLRLIAGRDFSYDRLLSEFNNAEPKPATVRRLLERLQSRTEQPEQQYDSPGAEETTAEPNEQSDFADVNEIEDLLK